MDIDKGYVVARYYSAEDYQKVLTGGSWTVMGHYLTIMKWKLNFKPTDAEVQSTLAWVRFSTLPLENFDDISLLSIGNAVGRAIKVDKNIVNAGKGKYSRVCVELNLNTPLSPNVMVWGRKQPVEYEGLPQIYFKCGCHGHKMKQWGSSGRTKSSNNTRSVNGKEGTQSKGLADQPLGPWMLPAYERHRQQLMQTRMNRRVQSLLTKRWNGRSKEREISQKKKLNTDGCRTFVFGSALIDRGKTAVSVEIGRKNDGMSYGMPGEQIKICYFS